MPSTKLFIINIGSNSAFIIFPGRPLQQVSLHFRFSSFSVAVGIRIKYVSCCCYKIILRKWGFTCVHNSWWWGSCGSRNLSGEADNFKCEGLACGLLSYSVWEPCLWNGAAVHISLIQKLPHRYTVMFPKGNLSVCQVDNQC